MKKLSTQEIVYLIFLLVFVLGYILNIFKFMIMIFNNTEETTLLIARIAGIIIPFFGGIFGYI